MAIIEGATSAELLEVGVAAAKPLHTISKPTPYGALGIYQINAQTGSIGAGAGTLSEVLQFRWTDATRLAVILEILVSGMRATTAFAAGVIEIQSMIARSWTADGSGGVNLVSSWSANQSKMRTSMGTSLVSSFRPSTTAALSVGTKTLDVDPISRILTHSSAGPFAATPIIGSIFLPHNVLYRANMEQGFHPMVFAQNEGFVVRCTVPGTGVWSIGFDVKWAEVTAF